MSNVGIPRLSLKTIISRATAKFGANAFKIHSTQEPNNVHEKVLMECLKCGDIYPKRINDLLHGYGCRACNFTGKVTKLFRTPESFRHEVIDVTNGEYSALGDFSATRALMLFKHHVCGNEFTMKTHNFITLHQRCPFCKVDPRGNNTSKGVKLIESYLDEHEIQYVREYRYDDLRSWRANIMLPFDFYLPEFNILIEYDGEQHFRPTELFGGIESFNRLKENDKRKDAYATEKGITLLRIPYTKILSISRILDSLLMEG